MNAIGLDIGTGFVKCVSDKKQIKFPSIYACRQLAAWEGRGIAEAVGDEAIKMAEIPNTRVKRPVMLGKPIDEKGFEKLVVRAMELSLESNDALGKSLENNCIIVVGLPYEAKNHAANIKKMITRLFSPKQCTVVAQVLGTLVDVQLADAVVMSLGHGTSEVVVFKNSSPIKGISIHHAVSEIMTEIGSGKTAYVNHEIFTEERTKPHIISLADALIDDLNHIRQDVENLPIVVSGGGILLPGMKEALESKLGTGIIVPKDPVFSNAIGLYKLAAKTC
ncbi:MAG: ParM/StbA family protein [Nitrosotalea sp.]